MDVFIGDLAVLIHNEERALGKPFRAIRAVSAGDAVLWPAGLDHKIWTEDEELWGIVVDGPPEREPA